LRGLDKYADEGMMVDVYGVMRCADGMGVVVCTAKAGGRTEGFVLRDRVGCEKEEFGRGWIVVGGRDSSRSLTGVVE